MGKKYTFLALLALLALAFLLCLPLAIGQGPPQPIGVTGHMAGVSGSPVAGTYIQFQLTNCQGGNPRILGYTGIAPSTGVFLPDDEGLVSGTIWANDKIDCGGVTDNSRWLVTNIVNNIPQGPPTCYNLLSSPNPFDLDTATPTSPCITATPILPNDATFHNIVVTGLTAGVDGKFTGYFQTYDLNNVWYVDPFSSVDLFAQINAIHAACGQTCIVHVPAKTGCYSVGSGSITFNHATESLIGDGAGAVCITYTGTGTPVTVRFSGSQYAFDAMPQFSGFGLTCTNPAVTTCFDVGNAIGIIVRDALVVGPAGLAYQLSPPPGNTQGLVFDNDFNWQERWNLENLQVSGFGTNWLVKTATGAGTDSYGYGAADIHMNIARGSKGLEIQPGAQLYHMGKLHIQFNAGAGVSAGANPVLIENAGNLSAGDGVIAGEVADSQAWTGAHIPCGGFTFVSGSIHVYSPTGIFPIVADCPDPGTAFPWPWIWGPQGDPAGVALETSPGIAVTNFPVAGNTDLLDVHPTHFGLPSGNTGYSEGMLIRHSDGLATSYQAADVGLPICRMNHNGFMDYTDMRARDCVDGAGNFFPLRAYQLVTTNQFSTTGPVDVVKTGQIRPADGDIVLASGYYLSGTFIVSFAGGTGFGRDQNVILEVGASQFDTTASLVKVLDYSYGSQTVLTNFRIKSVGGANPMQLVATVGNRDGGGSLTVTEYGDVLSSAVLLPGGSVGGNLIATAASPSLAPLTGTTGTITGTALTAACDSGTASVPGAIVGKPVSVSSTTGADIGGAFNIRGSVTSADTVTIYVCGTGTPASLAYNVTVSR